MFESINPKRCAELSDIAQIVAKEVYRGDVAQSYQILCSAQMVAYISFLSGTKVENFPPPTKDTELAFRLAASLSRLSMLEVTYVINSINLSLWPAHFIVDGNTAIGAAWQAHLKASDGGGSKIN